MARKEVTWPRADGGLLVADYLDNLLATALSKRFSDLFLLPKKGGYQLSGQGPAGLVVIDWLAENFAQSLMALLKYRARMDLAENRRPQLGRFALGAAFVRVSAVGDFLNRASMALRIIGNQLIEQRFQEKTEWQRLLDQRPPAGLFVLAGPTGSGKTTSLYALLNVWGRGRLVLTVEDPVEVVQPTFLQLQVNEGAGVSYEELVKVALRHRPDILAIGEIRDGQTAKAALQAALSGHLVLTTIHANSARQVLHRLVDLGLSEALVREALLTSVYQRLERDSAGGFRATLERVDWQ